MKAWTDTEIVEEASGFFTSIEGDVRALIAVAGKRAAILVTDRKDIEELRWSCEQVLAALGPAKEAKPPLAAESAIATRTCAGPDCGVWTTAPAGCDADPFTECPECSCSFCSDCKSIEGANVHLEHDADRRCAKCTPPTTRPSARRLLLPQMEPHSIGRAVAGDGLWRPR